MDCQCSCTRQDTKGYFLVLANTCRYRLFQLNAGEDMLAFFEMAFQAFLLLTIRSKMMGATLGFWRVDKFQVLHVSYTGR